MKYFSFSTLSVIAFLACSSITFLACHEDDDDPIVKPDPTPEVVTPSLKVGTTNLSFGTDGTSQSLQINCNVEWTITGKPAWLTLDPASGTGNRSVTVSASENTDTAVRKCDLTVKTADGLLSESVAVEQLGAAAQLQVNGQSSTTLNFGANGNESQDVTIKSNSSWRITSDYDWLRVTPGDGGAGNSTLKVTTVNENFSDEERIAKLTVYGTGSSTATITVQQAAKLAKNVRVDMSNTTIMCDGFACDLRFGSSAKGYKEAFFVESEVKTMTDRDIYNKLMEQEEYGKTVDWTYVPGWVDPNTTLVYCIAAYGNENNEDGSHKYGPMTIRRITTRSKTIYDDMYMSLSYTSSRWTVTTSRTGNYGQRCDEYYYYAAEGDYADDLTFYANRVTYAFLAHFAFKPMIAADPNDGYKYGPQAMAFSRSDDKFFCATWGIDRDTKEFSAEISWLNKDLGSNASSLLQRPQMDPSSWNQPRQIITREEVEALRKAIKMYRVKE